MARDFDADQVAEWWAEWAEYMAAHNYSSEELIMKDFSFYVFTHYSERVLTR